MADRNLYRLKPSVQIKEPGLDWLEHDRCYEGTWDEEFPGEGPGDFIVFHPDLPNEVARVERRFFEEVSEEEC